MGRPEMRARVGVKTDQALLEALSRRVLAGGLSWVVVERRWEAMHRALFEFEPAALAACDGPALDALMETPGVIRNAAKLEAVVANARAVVALADEHGSFGAWLADWRERTWEERVAELRPRFRRVGERTAWGFLEEVGEPVPAVPPWID